MTHNAESDRGLFDRRKPVESLHFAAALMRNQHGPDHERYEMWAAIAALLDHEAQSIKQAFNPETFVALTPRLHRSLDVAEEYLLAATRDTTPAEHDCAACPDCIHDGNKCCGCYDGACCQTSVTAPDRGNGNAV